MDTSGANLNTKGCGHLRLASAYVFGECHDWLGETQRDHYKNVIVEIQPTCGQHCEDLARAMKLPDLFSVISANFQLSQKSNNVVTFPFLGSETYSIIIQPLLLRTKSEDLNPKITKK